MLQDLHKKMESQKEAKKSSTAIEELIFQVKEVCLYSINLINLINLIDLISLINLI